MIEYSQARREYQQAMGERLTAEFNDLLYPVVFTLTDYGIGAFVNHHQGYIGIIAPSCRVKRYTRNILSVCDKFFDLSQDREMDEAEVAKFLMEREAHVNGGGVQVDQERL